MRVSSPALKLPKIRKLRLRLCTEGVEYRRSGRAMLVILKPGALILKQRALILKSGSLILKPGAAPLR